VRQMTQSGLFIFTEQVDRAV